MLAFLLALLAVAPAAAQTLEYRQSIIDGDVDITYTFTHEGTLTGIAFYNLDGSLRTAPVTATLTLPEQFTAREGAAGTGPEFTVSLKEIGTGSTGQSVFYCTGTDQSPLVKGDVVMPATVTDINNGAFEGCNNLPTLDLLAIRDHEVYIGADAFYNASFKKLRVWKNGLPYAVSPEAGTGYRAVLDRTWLESAEAQGTGGISGTVTFAGTVTFGAFEAAFAQCLSTDGMYFLSSRQAANITRVDVASGINELGNSVFSQWPALQEVHLSRDVTKLGTGCFSRCTALQRVEIDDMSLHGTGKETLVFGLSCFEGCSSLSSINMPTRRGYSFMDNSDGHLFYGTALTRLYLSGTLTPYTDGNGYTATCLLPPYLLRGCTQLQELVVDTDLPLSATQLGKGCFYTDNDGCTTRPQRIRLCVKEVPSGVTTGDGAFTLKNLCADVYADKGTATLVRVNSCRSELAKDESGDGYHTVYSPLTLPERLLAGTTAAEQEQAVAAGLPDVPFTALADSCLLDNPAPTLTLPYTVAIPCPRTKAQNSTASSAGVLMGQHIFNTGRLGRLNFYDDQGLFLHVEKEHTEEDMSAVEEENFSVLHMETSYDGNFLKGDTLLVPQNVYLSNLGQAVMVMAEGLKAMPGIRHLGFVDDGMGTDRLIIKYGAFQQTGIESVALPSNIYSVNGNAFNNCKNLKRVTMRPTENSVQLQHNAFWGCTALTSVQFADNVTHIGGGCFNHAPLAHIVLPRGLTSMGYVAFGSGDESQEKPLKMQAYPDVIVLPSNSIYPPCEQPSSAENWEHGTRGTNKEYPYQATVKSLALICGPDTKLYAPAQNMASDSLQAIQAWIDFYKGLPVGIAAYDRKILPYADVRTNALALGTVCTPWAIDMAASTNVTALYTAGDTDADDASRILLAKAADTAPGMPYVYRSAATEEKPFTVFAATQVESPFDPKAPVDKPKDTTLLTGTFVTLTGVAADAHGTEQDNTAPNTIPEGAYVLQSNGVFHRVYNTYKGKIAAYRAYIAPGKLQDGAAARLSVVFNDDTPTAIHAPADTAGSPQAPVYNLMGQRVGTLLKGHVYVVNGKKVRIQR